MNLHKVDLNLFLVFHAVYVTGSVTQAGERLGMTQSAVSNALKRLRERVNDSLFVRTPEGMVPTPLAQRLIGPAEAGLKQLHYALDQSRHFDVATSDRVFRIAINEIGHVVMMPTLLQAARQHAPHIRFETVDASPSEARQLMLQGQIDLAMGSWDPMGPSFFQQRLFDETFAVLMHESHPLAQQALTLEDYMGAGHLAFKPHGATDTELQLTLSRAGLPDQRHVVLSAAHSLGLAHMVKSTGLLLTTPNRLADIMLSEHRSLVKVRAPFEVQPFSIRQQWHERMHQDTGNRWLRELIFGLLHEPSDKARALSLDARASSEIACA